MDLQPGDYFLINKHVRKKKLQLQSSFQQDEVIWEHLPESLQGTTSAGMPKILCKDYVD